MNTEEDRLPSIQRCMIEKILSLHLFYRTGKSGWCFSFSGYKTGCYLPEESGSDYYSFEDEEVADIILGWIMNPTGYPYSRE